MEVKIRGKHITDKVEIILAGIRKRFVVEINGIEDESEIFNLIVLCKLTGINTALINDVRCLQTTASCRWKDRGQLIAETTFDIVAQEAAEDIVVTFSIFHRENESTSVRAKAIIAPARTAFSMPRGRNGMH